MGGKKKDAVSLVVQLRDLRPDNGDNRMSIHIDIFKDATARSENKAPVGNRSYTVKDSEYDTYFDAAVLDVVAQNHIERSYEYLKTLSEYSGASDV
jgi:hypothetical protein